jgi:hypothetical protein
MTLDPEQSKFMRGSRGNLGEQWCGPLTGQGVDPRTLAESSRPEAAPWLNWGAGSSRSGRGRLSTLSHPRLRGLG